MSVNEVGQTSPGLNKPRPRSRGFSFKSDKSNGSKPKESLAESPEEKRRRDSIWKNQSKANPNAALNEAQPGDAQLLEQATIEPLRNVQHKDIHGNMITDPDLCNPTRPRMERPLDTIRSFERAIDSGYKRRSSMIRGESYEQNSHQNRRTNSYGNGFDNHHTSNRAARHGTSGGYYGSSRPDSYAENNGRSRYSSRHVSEPMRSGYHSSNNHSNNFYPQHHQNPNHASHDTVGSDSTGPWANSTDPSSENSSLDRLHNSAGAGSNGKMHDGGAGYGYAPAQGMGRGIPEDGAYTSPHDNFGGPVQAPGAPPQQQQPQRKMISLGNSAGEGGMDLPVRSALPVTPRPETEKKKGWLSRKFSKKD